MVQFPPGTDLNDTPTEPPPDGVIPDFDKPAALANATIIVISLVTSINLFLLLIRIFTKTKSKSGVVLDDYKTKPFPGLCYVLNKP